MAASMMSFLVALQDLAGFTLDSSGIHRGFISVYFAVIRGGRSGDERNRKIVSSYRMGWIVTNFGIALVGAADEAA